MRCHRDGVRYGFQPLLVPVVVSAVPVCGVIGLRLGAHVRGAAARGVIRCWAVVNLCSKLVLLALATARTVI